MGLAFLSAENTRNKCFALKQFVAVGNGRPGPSSGGRTKWNVVPGPVTGGPININVACMRPHM